MKYDVLPLTPRRSVLLCGTNYYTVPDMHPDRILPEHDLLYVVEGEWSICQDDTHYIVRKDDAMLLHAGSHHYSIRPCAPNTRTLFIHFSQIDADQSGVDIPQGRLLDDCQGDLVYISTMVNCAHHGSVMRQMQRMMELYWTDRSDKQRQLAIQLELLLCELAYVCREQRGKDEEWLPRIQEKLRMNPSHMHSVQELAQIAGMSTRNFSTIFKRATGQTVHQYQLNVKLEMAFMLVRSEPERKLSDIATRFGFYDAYHFSRVFKSRYGFSPKHFRRGIGVVSSGTADAPQAPKKSASADSKME